MRRARALAESMLVALLLLEPALAATAETSALWGAKGERWNPRGRLPDFSHAGYHCGDEPPPRLIRGVSVKAFGAKGDGRTDDSAAFLKAIATVKRGAVEVPPGRYLLTQILEINRPGIVLRGAGPDRTILFFPKPLHEVKPDWSATTSGRRTSNYSWSGGFVWFKGSFRQTQLAAVTGEARRGDTTVEVSTPERLHLGQRIEILQTDTPDNSFAAELYSGDPGDTRELRGSTRASIVGHIRRIAGRRVEFDRPLRFDLQARWNPRIRSFDPSVAESGVENLTFEFPVTPYLGHFTEFGFNAVAFSGVADCWARNLHILNADSGVFPGGRFCTIANVVVESSRPPDKTGCTGHHGIYFYGDDNFFTGFDFRTRFIHDLTVSEGAGNVIAGGRGVDLCLDHHKRAPYENLFVDLDAGAGTRLWQCGGGAGLGKNCGARGTFWNLRAATPQHYPPPNFGPVSMNFVALQTDQPTETSESGRWFEAIAPASLVPPDLHAAQLARRLHSAKGR